MKPCPVCAKPHTNKTYCSRPCRNRGEWRANVTKGLERVRAMRHVQNQQNLERMIARCQVFGRTERERLVLAYRMGLKASHQRRHREKLKKQIETRDGAEGRVIRVQ